jgi:aryl-alcohol dehydrogenase-like predicted oxidoreductase
MPFHMTRAEFLKTSLGAAGAFAMAGVLPGRAALAALPLAVKSIPKSKTQTQEKLPVIGMGTSRTFNAPGDAAAMAEKGEVLKTLVEGGNADAKAALDTAANYGDAEEICGELLEKHKLRNRTFIATKFGETGLENGKRSIENSFKRLRTNMIDLMYIHNMVDVPTQLPNIEEYKAAGKFRYIGISDTSRNQDELATHMATGRLDFVEFSYSVDFRDAEKKLLPTAMDKGVAVFVALPFGRGRALKAVQNKEVPAWARAELNCQTFAQLLLKFIVSHPGVTTAIPATSNVKHMLENLDAGRGPMPDARQREKIAEIWANA